MKHEKLTRNEYNNPNNPYVYGDSWVWPVIDLKTYDPSTETNKTYEIYVNGSEFSQNRGNSYVINRSTMYERAKNLISNCNVGGVGFWELTHDAERKPAPPDTFYQSLRCTISTACGSVWGLQNDLPVENLKGTRYSEWHFKIYVPSSGYNLVVTTSNGTGNCDLYVRYDKKPTTSYYYDRKNSSSNNEKIVINNAQSGTWYIMIYGNYGYSGVTLKAKYEQMTGDPYEPDNDYQHAKWITVNASQQDHTIEPAGDEDWMKFSATTGTQYVLETHRVSGNYCDTYLYLYSTNGITEITHDDDSGDATLSKIIWTCGSSGTYYIKVKGYSSTTTGPYGITVSKSISFNPPRNLTATSGQDSRVLLSWDPPTSIFLIGDEPPEKLALTQANGEYQKTSAQVEAATMGLSGYNMYRSTSSGGTYTKINSSIITATSYTDYNVTNGTTYYYKATAVYSNPSGESGFSNMASATPQGSQRVIIFTENFENSFPGSTWERGDLNPVSGYDYWDDQSISQGARVREGNLSCYCADISDISGQQYDDNMQAYFKLVTGVNVSSYTDVKFSFLIWYDTESGYDYVKRYYSNDGVNWRLANQWAGNSNGWQRYTIALMNFTNYWIKFEFYSDGSVHNYEGAYIDDLVITGIYSAVLTKNSGEEPYEELIDGEIPEILISNKPLDESFNNHYIPKQFSLGQNYPNPFNPTTTICYALPEVAHVQVQIFDVNGREVKQLVDQVCGTGIHSVVWNGTDESQQKVSSGIYICRFSAGEVVCNRKLVLAK